MSSQTRSNTKRTLASPSWKLASVQLQDAYTDYILSRQAMQCTTATLTFYKYTAGVFLNWIESQSKTSPEQVDAHYVRQYFAELLGFGKADTTINAHARVIKKLLRFWFAEH